MVEIVEQRGRREHAGAALRRDRLDEPRGIRLRGEAEVHRRQHRGHAKRRIEQREQRERTQINFARGDAVGRLQQLDLRREDPVRVHRALRDPELDRGAAEPARARVHE